MMTRRSEKAAPRPDPGVSAVFLWKNRIVCRFALCMPVWAILAWGTPVGAGQITQLRSVFDTPGASLGGITSQGSVAVTISSSRLSGPINTAAGGILSTVYDATGTQAQASFLSFCVDLNHALDPGLNTGDMGTITSNPDTRNLLAAGWVMTNVVAKGAIGNYFAGLSGGPSQAAQNAAVQLAIWKVAYDPGGTDLSSGDLRAVGSGTDFRNAVEIANNIIADWFAKGSPGASAGLIDYAPFTNGVLVPGARTSQDLIYDASTQVSVVPEPSSLVSGLIGVTSLGLVTFWRSRRSVWSFHATARPKSRESVVAPRRAYQGGVEVDKTGRLC